MKRCLCFLLVFAAASTAARADLTSDIKTILQDKALQKTVVGVQIASLGGGEMKTIFRSNAETPLIPASNLKVVTTSAALDKLGPDFRFRTCLLVHDGDLVLWGDGDPTFGDLELLKKVGWDVTTVYKQWADELKKRGVTSVRNVIVDDSVFDQTFVHPNWPADQEHKRYVAQVGGMNLNTNCVDFNVRTTSAGSLVVYLLNPETHYINIRNTCVTGKENAIWLSRQGGTNDIILRGEANADMPVSVTINDPPMFAATVLSETMVGNGIKMTGTVQRDRTTREKFGKSKDAADAGGWKFVGVHETPLEQVMARANKDSINLYAETLCKRLGFAASGAPGSWENGTRATAAFLKKAGVPDGEYKLDDGCGLSKMNGISADAMVRVLAYDHASANRDTFLKTLSVAGGDGTLEERFKGSDLRGRVFGKTGFVAKVSALSGYLKAADGNWYAFAILMNDVQSSIADMKQIQEKIVRAVDQHAANGMAKGN